MKERTLTAAVLLATTCLTSPAWAQASGNANSDAVPVPPKQEAQAAPATGAHENVLEEVVVTSSRKRNESAQQTPVAITAVTGDQLERSHVVTFAEVGDLAPNLQMDKNLGTAGVTNIYLRGFGDYSNDPAVDPHVAVFVDGIYMPAPPGLLFDTFDLGSVEVDAGPQGTLVGKNAPIGAIYVSSTKPTGQLEGMVEADYGSYDHFGVRGVVNFPVIKDATGGSILAAKVSFTEQEGGNWVYNYADGKRDMGGENDKAAKVAFDFTPDPSFEWYVTATVEANRDPQNGSYPANYLGGYAGSSSNALQTFPFPCLFNSLFGFPAKGCERLPYGSTDSNFTSRPRSDFALVSSNMSWRLEPVTLTSVSGYLNYWQVDNSDDPGTPYVALNAYSDRTRYDEESEEFRISSNKGGGWDFDGKLDWVVGGYYSNFNYGFTNDLGIGVLAGFALPVGVVNTAQSENGQTESKALFGHFIYNFTDQWTGTFGVRQSWDDKTHNFQAGTGPYRYDIPAAWHNTSFEVGTAYQFDPDRMAYVRFAQGYQSGGFAGFAIGNEFNPELNDAYEIGAKTDWLDKRLRVNLDFFINELSQLQVESALAIPTPPGFLQETLNAGSATVEGWEAQIVAIPIENLTTHLNVGYLHTKFNQNNSTTCSNTPFATDCSGLPFAMAPKWTFNLGGDYVQDLPEGWGSLIFTADWIYRSSLYTSDPVYPSSLQNGYGLVNAAVTYQDPTDKYSIEFYGSNILDRHYKSGYTDPSGLGAWEKQGTPAEWGVKIVAKFGPFNEESPPAAAPPPVPAPAAPPPAPVAEAKRSFQVFFDFDKSNITAAAAKVIQAASDAVKAGNVVQVTVTGHTDTVGTASYNQGLSERRAAAVKGEMVKDGVAAGEITTVGVGKNGLLVPTADGVREPQNRRAEIVLQ